MRGLLPDLEALYKDIHAHPELSMQETRTATLAAGQNDPATEQRVVGALSKSFPGQVQEMLPTSASEDFGCFGTAWHVPSVFWFVGGTDPDLFDQAQKSGKLDEIPTNHNPRFAPVIHPTLETGVEALLAAARAWLAA